MGRFVDGVGEIDTEGMTVMVAMLRFLGLGKIVDLPEVGGVGWTAFLTVVFGEFFFVEDLHKTP